jgi:hypothetical protein
MEREFAKRRFVRKTSPAHGLAALAGGLVVLGTVLGGGPANASDVDDLHGEATKALTEGRPTDAIAAFEALADRGVQDAAVSFDRALAYAARVRRGDAQPGDLGQAAHAFEEARRLTQNSLLDREAEQGLQAVRSAIAHRKAKSGEVVDLERRTTVARSLVAALPEDRWAALALLMAWVFGVSMFLLRATSAVRLRLASTIALVFSLPALGFTGWATWSARDQRLHGREAVVVAPGARPTDERGIVLATGNQLPEGARVDVLATRGNLERVGWGGSEAWVNASTLRPLP